MVHLLEASNGSRYRCRLPFKRCHYFRVSATIPLIVKSPMSPRANFWVRFAPTRYRGRMIAAVFFWQPIGQLLAAVLALAATEGFRTNILKDTDPASCSIYSNPLTDPIGADCARTVDQVWRLVSGLGAVPAAIAIVFRLTIPESVSYVPLEVDFLFGSFFRDFVLRYYYFDQFHSLVVFFRPVHFSNCASLEGYVA